MIIRADARSLPLRDGCVQCVVTSPPYFGLRDYGNPQQIGLEPTPDAYVASLVAVFAEVRRVLKDDGTVWLNLGDSYAGGKTGRDDLREFAQSGGIGNSKRPQDWQKFTGTTATARAVPIGMKAKDLVGIPWRVAFALQADGWYLRSDIIWSKPNPMPESVTDRPTKAHEYLFLLAKSERYYYDAAAIREPYAESTLKEAEYGYRGTATKEYIAAGAQDPSETKKRIVETIRRRRGMVDGLRKNDTHIDHRKHGVNEWDKREPRGKALTSPRHDGNTWNENNGRGFIPTQTAGRNKRSVWTVPTMPYSGAHFATFPEKLIEPCILAGCPVGGVVLDPFLGSGTVGAVCERLGRRWVGTDLSYQPLAQARTAQRGIPFAV